MKNAPLEELRRVSPAQQGESWNALGSSSQTPRVGAAMSPDAIYSYTKRHKRGESWKEKRAARRAPEGESGATGGVLECLKAFQGSPLI